MTGIVFDRRVGLVRVCTSFYMLPSLVRCGFFSCELECRELEILVMLVAGGVITAGSVLVW